MSPSPDAVNHPRATGGTLLLLCACFLLSGLAALIYQTSWTRQFAIVFGTSELAVATASSEVPKTMANWRVQAV